MDDTPRAPLTLHLDAAAAEEAEAFGLDLTAVAEDAIATALKAERNRRWREENAKGLERYRERMRNEGPALAKHRRF